MSSLTEFSSRAGLKEPVEESQAFAPNFNADGLIPVAATDAAAGRLLMLAWMNSEALARTIETGQAWYWSRSRGRLWRKGESSGHTQRVVEIRADCDQDALELVIDQSGPACHTNRRSCFYRVIERTGNNVRLSFKTGS